MSAASRRKGVKGEREVAAIFERNGCTVHGLEGAGDHAITARAGAVRIHSEVKRQERLRMPEWSAQAVSEAPPGAVPSVAFRRNRESWWIALPLDAFASLLDKLP